MSKMNIDEKKCIHCGACTAVCNVGALSLKNEDRTLVFNKSLCSNCNTCVNACPIRAISLHSL